MILISTTHILREVDDDPLYNQVVDMYIHDLFKYFVKKEEKILLGNVGTDGEDLFIYRDSCCMDLN